MPIPDINYTDLHKAAEQCDAEKARAELDGLTAGKAEALNAVDREGYTPLAYAAQEACLEVVELLIGSGAAVDATDDHSRWTPLLRASKEQNAKVVEYLLKHGAAVDHKAGYLGQTPLTEAILGPFFGEDSQEGRRETVRLLLAAGADVNLPGRSGWTPLMTIVFRGDAELARLFMSKNADIYAKDEDGKNALDHAAERNETVIEEIILTCGPIP